MLNAMLVRLKALAFRDRVDAELDEELRYHLEREVERNVAHGMTEADAHDAARRALGNITVATEQARDALRWRWFEELRQDVSFAVRTFSRVPAFAFTVVATIGLGLGLVTTVFTVFNAYVLRPLPVRDPMALYEVIGTSKLQSTHLFTWQRFQNLRARADLLDDPFAYAYHTTRIRGTGSLGQIVSGNYFSMLGVPPALGRTLVPNDVAPPRGNDVVVLSHRMWVSSFGGDSAIIGQKIYLRDVPLTVVGVARDGFDGLGTAPIDFWAPLTASLPTDAEALRVVGRLRPGATERQTTQRFATWFQQQTSDRGPAERIDGAMLIPRGTSMPPNKEIYELFTPIGAAFVFVMLIACANVANMMLARGLARQREIGVRLALGAGRARLIRQLLTEALLLSIPSALLGFAISRLAIEATVRMVFATIPSSYAEYFRVIPLGADARMVAFMFATSVVAALAFGLAPALQSTRPNIVQASRGDFDTDHRPSRLRNGLVVLQITFSVVLLISAGVLLSNARAAQQLDPGVRTQDVMQMTVGDRLRSNIIERLRADAHVAEIASARSAPLGGGWWVIELHTATGQAHATNANVVSSEYFHTLDVPLVSGRTFTVEEATSRAPIAVVSEAAAQRFWTGRNPIGQTVSLSTTRLDSALFGPFRNATVIGVVRNAIPGTLFRSATWPAVYYPQPLAAPGARLLARTHGNADVARPHLAAVVASIDSAGAEMMHPVAVEFDFQVYPFRAAYWLATVVGCAALLLTIAGVYGVMSYLVSQRRKEFGIRMALGAAAETIVGMVLRQSLRLSLIGLTIGIVIALGVSRLVVGAVLVNNSFDARGYAIGIVVVAVACIGAAYLPSLRAAKAPLADVLRNE